MRWITFAMVMVGLAGGALAEIRTETIEYAQGDLKLKGFLAYDDAVADQRAGVLVIPEWWGLNDYPKSRAEQLAALGYVAFVADMYGEGKTTTDPGEAGRWAGAAREAGLAERAQAALDVLKRREQTDPARVAAIGYCFGGTTVLEMARAGHDLRGVVSFHGNLATAHPARDGVTARILVLHGAADPMVPPAQVNAFKEEMDQADADYRVIEYEGAVHAFSNPNADKAGLEGVAYQEKADKESWEAMKAFLSDVLK